MDIKTTRNLPQNITEEVAAASQLEGLVSKETQLSVLSIVPNIAEEMERMEKEKNSIEKDIVINRMFGGQDGQ